MSLTSADETVASSSHIAEGIRLHIATCHPERLQRSTPSVGHPIFSTLSDKPA